MRLYYRLQKMMTMPIVDHTFVVAAARSALSWRVTACGTMCQIKLLEGSRPKQAVSELMEHCLQHGGYRDDVTILVDDVTIPS